MIKCKEDICICLIYVAAIILIILISLILSHFFEGDPLSWVQAIGIIFAIISSVFLAGRQIKSGVFLAERKIKNQREKKREEERTLAKAVHFLTYDAFNLVCDRLNNVLSDKRKRNLQETRTTEMIHTMKDFPIVHVPVSMLQNFIQIKSRLVAINEAISGFNKDKNKEEYFKSSIQALCDALKYWSELSKVADDSFCIKIIDNPVKYYPDPNAKVCPDPNNPYPKLKCELEKIPCTGFSRQQKAENRESGTQMGNND